MSVLACVCEPIGAQERPETGIVNVIVGIVPNL